MSRRPEGVTFEQLITLLGEVTGWGEHVTLHTRRQEGLRFVSHDETERTGVMYFTVWTTVCGTDKMEVTAHDKDYLDAIWKLCEAVPAKLKEFEESYAAKRSAAQGKLLAALEKK